MLINEYDKLKKYLANYNLQKKINKLAEKYKNKRILIYGAGLLSEVIFDNYNLTKLNLIGIADKKFEWWEWREYTSFKGHKAIKRDEIKELNPDVILLSVNYTYMIEDMLYDEYKLDYTKIKIERILPKTFIDKFKDYILTELIF